MHGGKRPLQFERYADQGWTVYVYGIIACFISDLSCWIALFSPLLPLRERTPRRFMFQMTIVGISMDARSYVGPVQVRGHRDDVRKTLAARAVAVS